MLAVFEVGVAGAVERGGGADAESEPRDKVVVESIEPDPLPTIQLVGSEVDAMFFVGQVATIEEEQELVPIPVVGCPVDGDESARVAVDAELFGQFAAAGSGRRFTALDVAARNVPGLLVDGMDQ